MNSTVIKDYKVSGSDLEIEFTSGTRYLYLGAAKEVPNLIASASMGKYFVENIRNNYSYKAL